MDRLRELRKLRCYTQEEISDLTGIICLNFCHDNNLCITCGGDGHGSFGRIAEGVIYDIGIMKVEREKLQLQGIYES